ncbi:MAG TPA: hypothetical protein EYP73_00555, partial [Acidimicrobiia bacterium]|nr:hypothetical protein [Acidimicrobiia bacterium]
MNLFETGLLSTVDSRTLSAGAVFVLVMFVFIWVGFGVSKAREDLRARLGAYGRQSPQTVREEELAKPLAQRTVGPLVIRISNFLRRFTPVGYLEKKQHQLILAGSPGSLDAPAMVVIKLLTTALGLIGGFFLISFGADTLQRGVLFLLPVVLGFFGPDA